MRRLIVITIAVSYAPSAEAVPGPDSVAVLANRNVPGSVELAERYRAARDIPTNQVCRLVLPAEHTITIDEFNDQLVGPLQNCLGEAWDRIEAIVLMRGVPQRVTTTSGRASLAAALQVVGSTVNGMPLLSMPPGSRQDCGGTPCTAAEWRNPYDDGSFDAQWSRTFAGVDYRMRLVTAIDARTVRDAERLIASATTAEALGGADGEFLFMDGADTARGVLDREYNSVINALTMRGFVANRVPFNRDETGHELAAFFVGTARLDETIEGNRFEPGSIVDNLTSFGAVPENFMAPDQERQVSIARWVTRGVAGVHGTTDEPLNNCFPSRNLIVDYVDGYSLAESFQKNMPFVYWRNLVLGDPMTAPYATRPTVAFEGLTDGETIVGARRFGVVATDPDGRSLGELKLFVNGELVESTTEIAFVRCQVWTSTGATQLLAVSQVSGEPRTKGWTSLMVDVLDGSTDCDHRPDSGVVDSGVVDSGVSPTRDAGTVDSGVEPTPEDTEGGCACSANERTENDHAWVIVLGLLLIRRRR